MPRSAAASAPTSRVRPRPDRPSGGGLCFARVRVQLSAARDPIPDIVTSSSLERPARIPAPGRPAPDFELQSTAGEAVRLSDFRGRSPVLLAFFPLAFTSTCTAELCAFSDDFDQFVGKGVAVLPISVDSVPSLKEFKAKYAMKTDLLSDFRREASRAYGVLREDRFYSERAYFLVDREGILRWAFVEDSPGNRRANSELLERIAALS